MKLYLLLASIFLVGCASVTDKAKSLQIQQTESAAVGHSAIADLSDRITAAKNAIATTQPTQAQINTVRDLLSTILLPSGPLSTLDTVLSSMESIGQKQAQLASDADAALTKERSEFWSYRQRRDFAWACVIVVALLIGIVLLRVASSPAASAALGPAWTGVANFFGHLLTGCIALIYKFGERIVVWIAKLTGRAAVAVGTRAAPLVAKMAPTPSPSPPPPIPTA